MLIDVCSDRAVARRRVCSVVVVGASVAHGADGGRSIRKRVDSLTRSGGPPSRRKCATDSLRVRAALPSDTLRVGNFVIAHGQRARGARAGERPRTCRRSSIRRMARWRRGCARTCSSCASDATRGETTVRRSSRACSMLPGSVRLSRRLRDRGRAGVSWRRQGGGIHLLQDLAPRFATGSDRSIPVEPRRSRTTRARSRRSRAVAVARRARLRARHRRLVLAGARSRSRRRSGVRAVRRAQRRRHDRVICVRVSAIAIRASTRAASVGARAGGVRFDRAVDPARSPCRRRCRQRCDATSFATR